MVAEAKGRISLDGKPFVDTLRDIQGELDTKFSKSLDNIGSKLADVFTVTAIVNFGKQIISLADEISNSATKIGVGVETLQSLKVAATEAGIQFGTVESAIMKATTQANNAVTGNKQLTEAFNTLGLSVEDLRGIDPEQLFESIAKSMANNKDSAQVLEAAYDVLGSQTGPELKELLVSLGEEGFESVNERMREANQIMSEEAIDNWDNLGDKIEEAGRVIKSFVGEYGASAIQFLKDTAGAWGAWSAGGSLSIEDFRKAQKEVDESNRKNKEAADERARAQSEYADNQREELKLTNNIADLQKTLAKQEYDKLSTAEKLNEKRAEEKRLLDEINGNVGTTNEAIKDRLEDQIELNNVQNEIVKLEKDLASETEKTNDKKRDGTKEAKNQLDSFNKLKEILAGITDEELTKLLTMMQKLSYAIAGLADVPKDKLEWVNDLAKLKFVGITSSQAAQIVRALTELITGIANLPNIPQDKLKFLEYINDLKFTGITSGQARQMARAIGELVNGVNGVDTTKIKEVIELLKVLDELGFSGKATTIDIKLPPNFKGIPLILEQQMSATFSSIESSLKTLAGLRGVVWV